MSSSSEHFRNKNKHLVELGVITSPHGIKGAVKIKTFTQAPESLLAYGPLQDQNGAPYTIHILEIKTIDSVIAQVEGVSNRNAAEALRGVFLYANRESLPPAECDEFYHSDLIGLTVKTSDDVSLGTVKAVFNFGAGDILDILTTQGKSVFVPFRKETIPVVDLEKGQLIIDDPSLLSNDPNPCEENS